MKAVVSFLTSVTLLFGFADHIETFSADFVQTVTDDTNKTITYEGHLETMRPDRARWDYTSPVEKSVFIVGHTVTIIEPELEQAIVKEFRDDIDLFRILENARPLGEGVFLAEHGSQKFLIKMKGDVLQAISYLDAFENRIRIRFLHQKVNPPLEASALTPHIPEDFDVLTE